MPNESLLKLLNRHAIKDLADERSFSRGEQYQANGRVISLTEHGGHIVATVQGTEKYHVRISAKDRRFEYFCDCPVGAEGDFCKHCVATSLEWLAGVQKDARSVSDTGERPVTMDEARDFLARQDKSTLVDMLLDESLENDLLRERIFMKAAKQDNKSLNLATFRKAIIHATASHGYVDYRSAYGFSRGIDEVVNQIDTLLKEGRASEVIELAEFALAKVEKALGSMDDSDGYMRPILDRLQEIHLAACKEALPDPETLTKRLFKWETSTGYDTFSGAAVAYQKVLGKKGLALYRKLAEAEWKNIPQLGPGQRDPAGFHGRFRITHIMEDLAKVANDIEELVAVKSRDLSYAYSYLQIAEAYKAAGKEDAALDWAERGLKAFPERTDSRLRDFVAAEYHRLKRHDDAMRLVWQQFMESPGLHPYRKLKEHADKVGQWQTWREKALACLRESIAGHKQKAKKDGLTWYRVDNSDLVEIFLWEKDAETAWREAKDGGCSDSLSMKLASLREKDHPEDALAVYRKQIEPILSQKNVVAYGQAVELLRTIRFLMIQIGRETEFAPYLESVRAAHKPKRNFLKLLDQKKWT
ncbi:MAG: hypothetical protein A2X28_06335 [Elusimicrobia bacterium GWA2_56_46]|nr:MAG: hypothetical protein A2X28_06335 [Elusimicrobia bacterium GWA2_56_46]OGR54927.1 MAG: hypothetical protein A2X39_11655 [Elusimicrobia bacterium GWC2_56_31]HBW23275.1 hypothetical protein [Elusimicrobiota bacterium]